MWRGCQFSIKGLLLKGYCISSNNIQGQLFLFLHQKGVNIRAKVIIRGRWLFQILLTGSRVLNILFYYPINQKIITSNKLKMGFLSVPNLVPWLILRARNGHWWVLLDQIPLKLDQEELKERKAGKRGGEGDDHSREAIIFNISIKREWLFKGGDYRIYSINRLGHLLNFGPWWEWPLIQGGRLLEAGRLLNFWTLMRVVAYSRWVLIRGWALIKFSPFSASEVCLFCNKKINANNKTLRSNKARFL